MVKSSRKKRKSLKGGEKENPTIKVNDDGNVEICFNFKSEKDADLDKETVLRRGAELAELIEKYQTDIHPNVIEKEYKSNEYDKGATVKALDAKIKAKATSSDTKQTTGTPEESKKETTNPTLAEFISARSGLSQKVKSPPLVTTYDPKINDEVHVMNYDGLNKDLLDALSVQGFKTDGESIDLLTVDSLSEDGKSATLSFDGNTYQGVPVTYLVGTSKTDESETETTDPTQGALPSLLARAKMMHAEREAAKVLSGVVKDAKRIADTSTATGGATVSSDDNRGGSKRRKSRRKPRRKSKQVKRTKSSKKSFKKLRKNNKKTKRR
jgi:hypothetical protein